MTGRAARPIEALVQATADWYRVELELFLAEVGKAACRFRVAGLPEDGYLHGRLLEARYDAWIVIAEGRSYYYETTWRGRSDPESRPARAVPKSTTWPDGWPPNLPAGLPPRMRDTWIATVDHPSGKPYAVAAGLEHLERWVRHRAAMYEPGISPSRFGIHARADRRLGAALGVTHADRMAIGRHHERERLQPVV